MRRALVHAVWFVLSLSVYGAEEAMWNSYVNAIGAYWSRYVTGILQQPNIIRGGR